MFRLYKPHDEDEHQHEDIIEEEPKKLNDIYPNNTYERIMDISWFFSRSVFSIEPKNDKQANIDISTNRFEYISLKKKSILQVRKLKNYKFLDLADGNLFFPPLWKMFLRWERGRSSIIDLTPPIHAPYNTIDLRPMQRVETKKKHADIYSQKLPFFFQVRRGYRVITASTYRLGVGIGVACIVLLFISLPLKWFLESSVMNAYLSMKDLHFSAPTVLAKEAIEVRSTFEKARLYFFPFNVLLNNPLIQSDKILLANTMIAGGLKISHAIDMFARSLPVDGEVTDFMNINPSTIFPLGYFSIEKPTDWMRKNEQYLRSIVDDIDLALFEYNKVSSVWKAKYDTAFLQAKWLLAVASKYGHFFMDNFESMLLMLGDKEPQRYAIFNQNRDELRANGGFPGTVITVTLYKGNITEYRKDDVYYYDWHLFPNKEIPPPGLDKIANNFWVRDVNYFPEFEKTLEKANYFIEKAGEKSITSMIAINQWVIIDLLKKYGPVRMDELGQDITGEDFSFLMSTLVEAKYAKDNHPKEILFGFIDNFAKLLLEKKDITGYAEIFEKNFMKWDILIASRNREIADFIESFKFYEQWKTDTRNWLYPVFTSISGNKSDRYMKRAFSVKTKPWTDACTIENNVRIVSTHTFDLKEEKRVRLLLKDIGITDLKQENELVRIQWMGENRQYIRLLVPKDSTLTTSASGIVTDKANPLYTSFNFYFNTPVNKTSEYSLSYLTRLPDCKEGDSKPVFYRQPWLENYTFIAE